MAAKIRNLIITMMVFTMTFSMIGCSGDETDTGAATETGTETVSEVLTDNSSDGLETQNEETPGASAKATSNISNEATTQGKEALATITLTWDISYVTITDHDPENPGEPDGDADLVVCGAGDDLEIGKLKEEYNGDKLLYDALLSVDGNTKKFTCNIYSWDCGDMDFEAEPCAPTNFFPDVDLVITQQGKPDIHKTGAELMIYSYTGIHFYGLCSVRDGEVVDWVIPEWLTEGMENVER